MVFALVRHCCESKFTIHDAMLNKNNNNNSNNFDLRNGLIE